MNILSHPATRLAAIASVVTAAVVSVRRRPPVVILTDETQHYRPRLDTVAPLAGLDVDALVASGELGYIDTTSRTALAAQGLLDENRQYPVVTDSATKAADLAAELERRCAATVGALGEVLAVEHQAMRARAALLADLDALGRAA